MHSGSAVTASNTGLAASRNLSAFSGAMVTVTWKLIPFGEDISNTRLEPGKCRWSENVDNESENHLEMGDEESI